LRILDRGKPLLEYEPSAKQYLGHNADADEVFFGGALFGGKSFWLLMHLAKHCLQWGGDAETIMFRRTYDELKRSVLVDVKRLFHGVVGQLKGVESQPVFEWDNGAVTYFRHLQEWTDVEKHDSAQYTLIAFDELTHFDEAQYVYLFQRLRSPRNPDIKPQIISASNPRGVGHKWVYDRFIKGREENTIYRFQVPPIRVGNVTLPANEYSRVYIPSVSTDNKAGMKADGANYLARMSMNMAPEEFDALVRGDWTVFMGRAFSEWDTKVHVVEPFKIPAGWKVIRTMDWGYAAPFAINWLAQDPRTKTIYLVAEWYGARRGPGGGVKGLEMSPAEVRQGILDRERAFVDTGEFPRPWYGKADPAIFKQDQMGKCVADDLNQSLGSGGMLFTAAENNRVLGVTTFHGLLRMDPAIGHPGFVSFKRCQEFNSQFAKLVSDPKKTEDVDTKQADHAYDAVRYGVVDLVQTRANQLRPDSPFATRSSYGMPVAV